MRKKSKEDEQTLEELNLVPHHRLQANCHLVQTSYIKQIKLFLFLPHNKHLITELSRSVWENLDLGRVHRPHCVRAVLTTSVKILPYRPPARLMRANYWPRSFFGEFMDLTLSQSNIQRKNLVNIEPLGK